MIKNIQYLHYLGHNKAINLFQFKYKIIDDDFEWIGVGSYVAAVSAPCTAPARADAVINCYSEKKLPIAPNFIKAILILEKKYSWNIEQQIIWNKKYCPNWYLVEKDLNKYLSLI